MSFIFGSSVYILANNVTFSIDMYISAYYWHYEHSRNCAGNEFKNINYRRDGFVLYWSVICLGSSATIRRLFQSGRLLWVEDKDIVLFVYSVSKTRFRSFFFFNTTNLQARRKSPYSLQAKQKVSRLLWQTDSIEYMSIISTVLTFCSVFPSKLTRGSIVCIHFYRYIHIQQHHRISGIFLF